MILGKQYEITITTVLYVEKCNSDITAVDIWITFLTYMTEYYNIFQSKPCLYNNKTKTKPGLNQVSTRTKLRLS